MYQEKASFTLRPAIENEIKLKYLPGFLFNAMSCRGLTAKCKDQRADKAQECYYLYDLSPLPTKKALHFVEVTFMIFYASYRIL